MSNNEEVKSYHDEFRDSYGEFALADNARSLPNIFDGLKLVHRRLLTAGQKAAPYSNKLRKSAVVTSQTVGLYHPVGDSVYESLARLVQPFANPVPLVMGQGNFGSTDGSSQAAQRYTEVAISQFGDRVIMDDFRQNAYTSRPNYDQTCNEPITLPTRLPLGIINGVGRGIGSGISACYPPHNPREVVDALLHYLSLKKEGKVCTVADLMKFIKGPDLPTGGVVNAAQLPALYCDGASPVLIRAACDIVEPPNSRSGYTLIFTGIPYESNTTQIIASIIEKCRPKKTKINGKEVEEPGTLQGIIKDVNDVSEKPPFQVVIPIIEVELKAGVDPHVARQRLYAETLLQTAKSFQSNWVDSNFTLLYKKNLVELFDAWLVHRINTIIMRTRNNLGQTANSIHQMEGVISVLGDTDEFIKIVRNSDNDADAVAKLRWHFKITDVQANYVLRLEIRRLTKLSVSDLSENIEKQKQKRVELLKILNNDEARLDMIIAETEEFVPMFKKYERKTLIEAFSASVPMLDMIEKEDVAVILQENGNLVRIPSDTFIPQNRGGKGRSNVTKSPILNVCQTSTHDKLLITTQSGNLLLTDALSINEKKGTSVQSLGLPDGHVPVAIAALPRDFEKQDNACFIMVTQKGQIKKSQASVAVPRVAQAVLGYKFTDDEDTVVASRFAYEESSVIIAALDGCANRIAIKDLRASGRASGGARGMKLGSRRLEGNMVVGMAILDNPEEQRLFCISARGLGRMIPFDDFPDTSRGTTGRIVQTIRKDDYLAGIEVINPRDTVNVFTAKGNTIAVEAAKLPTLNSRASQGSRIIDLAEDDYVLYVSRVPKD